MRQSSYTTCHQAARSLSRARPCHLPPHTSALHPPTLFTASSLSASRASALWEESANKDEVTALQMGRGSTCCRGKGAGCPPSPSRVQQPRGEAQVLRKCDGNKDSAASRGTVGAGRKGQVSRDAVIATEATPAL